MPENTINIHQIRELASRFTAAELEACIQAALGAGADDCVTIEDGAAVVSVLSMAGFVRAQMEQNDLSVSRAMRILGQRMRALS